MSDTSIDLERFAGAICLLDGAREYIKEGSIAMAIDSLSIATRRLDRLYIDLAAHADKGTRPEIYRRLG